MDTRPHVRPRAGFTIPLRPPPILVVDDDLASGLETLHILAGAGYPTTAESDGDAVLRLVRAELLRLVISEIHIPCAESPCLVTALMQERARLPRLRVLVHTRHTSLADDAWALAAGCNGILHKPASPAELLREVLRLDGEAAREPLYEGRSR
jgi:CheY-like chemotaxis protein